MIIKVERTGDIAHFEAILSEVAAQESVAGILVLACDANDFGPAITDSLKSITQPVFGGIFPEIIHDNEKLSCGTVVVGFSHAPDVQVIPSLSDPTVDYGTIIEEKFPDVEHVQTMFVWVDGLSSRISALIDSLFNVFGLEFNYIGGGAGSLSFQQKPCLFTNEGLIEDSAVLALFDMPSGIGVSHGWTTISDPFRVTESEGNVIKTVDWRPAFEVYREVVEAASGQKFTDDNFFEIAKAYPFGISILDSEKIVRDPIMRDENDALICVGEVPQECYVSILTGNITSLVSAAGNALNMGNAAFEAESEDKMTLFIDCISRVLFLEDQFYQELEAVFTESEMMVGALTLGEIANSGQDYLEFYNKTAVVGILGVSTSR
ncbi:FIST N-terminal domain-containing protein [Anaerolineales bacterium HSG6]|nr:FIST N-terminal domain-containing protein [Anaerolineales bacterium HSG6]MDM8531105.1 FIST N-terminal domain-containing protein [Anaerolineales bacterium HSG25]